MAGLFTRAPQVQRAWEFRANGIIWRLLVSSGGLIVGEDRNKDDKTVTFFCVDSNTGETRWKNVLFDQSWWVGLEFLHDDVAIFHEYAKPDMPEHKKLHVADLATGKRLWTDERHRFMFAREGAAYVSRDGFEKRFFLELDLHTGEFRRELDINSLNDLRTGLPEAVQPVDFPEQASPGGSDFPIRFLGDSRHPVVFTEFLSRAGCVVATVYTNESPSPGEPSLTQDFRVFDSSTGKELYADRLNEKANVPVPDAFFARGNRVMYIQNKSILRAIDLPSRDAD